MHLVWPYYKKYKNNIYLCGAYRFKMCFWVDTYYIITWNRMFGFLKKTLTNIYNSLSVKLFNLFGRATIDEEVLKELEILLLSSDVGVATTRSIIAQLRTQVAQGVLADGSDLKKSLEKILLEILLSVPSSNIEDKKIITLVGINGSGKTTCIGKFAQHYSQKGKRVLLVAADTFRAAATQQLTEWASRNEVDIQAGVENQDPASVVYAGCQRFLDGKYDILLIDTAGRLHTKINLMNELAKITRTIAKLLPGEDIVTLLTIDSMLGQNSLEQAILFKQHAHVDGVILTKMDGTGKGGIVFAIAAQLQIPILYITFGEQSSDIKKFEAQEYVQELLSR